MAAAVHARTQPNSNAAGLTCALSHRCTVHFADHCHLLLVFLTVAEAREGF
jgi:hypothetical protein